MRWIAHELQVMPERPGRVDAVVCEDQAALRQLIVGGLKNVKVNTLAPPAGTVGLQV